MPTIAERFSGQEIYDKLRGSFDREDLTGFHFEYAITANESDYSTIELKSPGFFTESLDTVHNKRVYIPITLRRALIMKASLLMNILL